jgi:hypothetical protein
MTTQIVKIDPAQYGLESTKAAEIEAAFKPMLEKMTELENEYNTVVKVAAKEITPQVCNQAKDLRLKYVKVRTGTAAIHKDIKDFYLKGGRFVDGWKNAQLFASQGIEDKLKDIEEYHERREAERIEALRIERWTALQPYMDYEPEGLGKMPDLVFDNFLSGTIASHNARIEAERKAEADRIAKEKAEAEERERIRMENEALKKAAIEREKKAEAERKEAEAKQRAIEDAARIERKKAEAERRKLQAELDAKAEAERKAKAEAERIERDRIARETAAKKAPDKDKLKAFVDAIALPELPELKTFETVATLNVIITKFEAFKTWANNQIAQS